MKCSVGFEYVQFVYFIVWGLGESYAGCKWVSLLFVARGFAAPGASVNPYVAVNYTYYWAVVVKKPGSRYIFPPKSGMGAFSRPAFSKENGGLPV